MCSRLAASADSSVRLHNEQLWRRHQPGPTRRIVDMDSSSPAAVHSSCVRDKARVSEPEPCLAQRALRTICYLRLLFRAVDYHHPSDAAFAASTRTKPECNHRLDNRYVTHCMQCCWRAGVLQDMHMLLSSNTRSMSRDESPPQITVRIAARLQSETVTSGGCA